ncbi:hypothetical protein Tco_0831487 [Tanacetum coccineum]
MSGPSELNLTPLTSAVRNTMGKGNEQISKKSNGPASDAALREYCDKHYHQLFTIIAEKVHQEKVHQEKLKEVKSRLNFKEYTRNPRVQEVSQHSKSRTPKVRGEHQRRRRLGRSRRKEREEETVEYSLVWEIREKVCLHTRKAATRVTAQEEHNLFPENATMKDHIHGGQKYFLKVCEETDPFTTRIHYFDLPKKTRIPNNVKTYDESDDAEDHLKIFQAAAKVERWAMPTWYHMFNSTLVGSARVWFDDLPPESIDGYDDLKKAFLANFLQQKKCI